MRASDQPWDIAIHYTGWSRVGTRSGREADARAIQGIASDFAAGRLKVDCAWNLVETSDGVYDFTWVDHVCAVGARTGLKVTLILNSHWGVPDWLSGCPVHQPFALNAGGLTGRQGATEGSEIGRYPMPPILCGSSAWVQKRLDRWRAALIQHVESRWPGLVDEYVCEGEIYLNPDNEFGEHVMDYNPHTLALFRKWLRTDRQSPYRYHPSPRRGVRFADVTLNQRWGRQWDRWEDVEPPRMWRAEDPATIDWLAFREWLVARWYLQSAAGVRRCTRARITTLINTFWGIPMPGGHVWSPSRTGNRLWTIFQALRPYVDSLGVTAYAYDPDFELDSAGRWQTSLMFLQGCARALNRPVRIVEGGGIMRARTLADLRWQLYCSRALGHAGVVLGYFGMPSGQNRNYDWGPARTFANVSSICSGFVHRKNVISAAPAVLVVYGADAERVFPFDSVEAQAVRAACRHLRDAGLCFELVDSAAIDEGRVDLKRYRAVVMPGGAVLSTRCLGRLIHAPVLAASPDAGRRDLLGNHQKGVKDLRQRPTLWLSASELAHEQACAEAGAVVDRSVRPWVRQLAESAGIRPGCTPDLVQWAQGWWFNRSAEDTLTAPDGARVPPGQEYPAVSVAFDGDSDHPGITGWHLSGASAGSIRETPEGLNWQLEARGAPAAYWEARLQRGVPGLPVSGRIVVTYRLIGSSWPTGVSLSLIAWNTRDGRLYVYEIPVRAQDTVTVSVTDGLRVPNAQRAAQIDHCGLCVQGSGWPALHLHISSFEIRG